jgi:hypothetical protein
LPETSTLLPTDTNEDSPSPMSDAYCITASPSAPLCDRNPTRPGGGYRVENVPFSRTSDAVFTIPMQFGPMIRIPYERARSTSSTCRAVPSPPTSLKPDEITTSPRTPFSPHSRVTSSTSGAGTTMNASSTSFGTSTIDGYAGTPCTTSAFGLTGNTGPLNRVISRLWNS